MKNGLIHKNKARLKKCLDILVFLLARILSSFTEGRGIWLVAEKTDEARDNGYWFYRYIRTKHPENKAFFVISPNSADIDKIRVLGESRIITPLSWKHKVLFWSAEFNVCSQPHSNYFSAFLPLKSLKHKYQLNVFLQHGIIKDNLSHGLDASKSGIDIFITSAKREQHAVILRHGYNEASCVLTGLCRFDNLPLKHEIQSRTIVVMPTFRHWIMASQGSVATEEEMRAFLNDSFCKTYNEFLSSPRLELLLEQFDYRLFFYPHYCAQPFLECFDFPNRSSRIVLASKSRFDVQSLLVESDILITDFSSVFFDFAYMRKPVIFFQFDEDRYRSGHYEEGYFQYNRDGFGPVFKTSEEVLIYLEDRLIDDSRMEDMYVQRVDDFFAYSDNNNCERTYNAITHFKKSNP